MNHKRQYDLLIAKAKLRLVTNQYVEKHHVIPKSIGGSNGKDNIVLLTAREHFVAHMLLAKIYGKGLWQAAKMMQNKSSVQDRRFINNRLYEIARREWAIYLSGKKRPSHVGESIRKHHIGSKASEETKAKMSATRKGKPRSGNPENWKHSEETKQKLSKIHKERSSGSRLPIMHGDENPMKKPENRAKISEAKKAYWQRVKAQKLLQDINDVD